ncbi:SRPBCC domain-containing protein [Arsenicicoccus piscis]|nr:SRPBCC domain-containing protein [Arsenicicoccus piscis]MCH8629005.1 SRPBCC domain-containing protein [Arsenicicoccus piscis]
MAELVIDRDFAAPCERLFQAFTDPTVLVEWYGPVGFSVPRTTCEIDPRVGGRRRLELVNDDDPVQRLSVDATFTELDPPWLIASQEELPDGGTYALRIEIDCCEGKERSHVRLVQLPWPGADVEQIRSGWESSFTKLDALLDL